MLNKPNDRFIHSCTWSWFSIPRNKTNPAYRWLAVFGLNMAYKPVCAPAITSCASGVFSKLHEMPGWCIKGLSFLRARLTKYFSRDCDDGLNFSVSTPHEITCTCRDPRQAQWAYSGCRAIQQRVCEHIQIELRSFSVLFQKFLSPASWPWKMAIIGILTSVYLGEAASSPLTHGRHHYVNVMPIEIF